MAGIKLYVMDNGEMWLDKRNLLADFGMATNSTRNPPVVWTHIPIQTFLIDHPDGRILFDTGCNPQGMSSAWPEWIKEASPYVFTEEQLPLNRLGRLGFAPRDITHVIISHLHVDHAGCLDRFADSSVIVADAELTTTMRNYALDSDLGVHMKCDIQQWIKAGLRWAPVPRDAGDFPLLDGVRVLNLGSGHSWGMLGLLIDLPRTGKIILASDALYTADNYGPPLRLPGIVNDTVGYARTAACLRELARQERATIWFGHDREQFATLRKSDQGFYD